MSGRFLPTQTRRYSRREEVQLLEFVEHFSYSINFTFFLERISERRVVKQKAANRKQLENVK